MFYDLIQPYLCIHTNDRLIKTACSSLSLTPRHFIQCRECSLSVDVEHLILNGNPKDPIASIQIAYEFARLTGEIHIPCQFIVSKIDRILPKTITTKLSNLLKGIELLKAINSPFLTPDNTAAATSDKPPPNRKLFQNLMADYLNLFNRTSSNNTTHTTTTTSSSSSRNNSSSSAASEDIESVTIRAIVSQMQNAFSHVNFFEQYFNILTPYVQSLAVPAPVIQDEGTPTRMSVLTNEPIPIIGDILYRELDRARLIRQTFSKYCVAFDVAYVTILCFICGDDVDVLYNLILDLSARLCTGYFVMAPFPLSRESPNPTLAQTIETFISRFITPTQNIQLYYHLQKFKRDEIEECFSEEFLKHFGELSEAIRKRIGLIDEGTMGSHPILKYAYQQTYPYILFEGKDWEYYGFVMALAHYIGSGGGSSSSNHHAIRKHAKGIIANSRKIYRFVKRAVLKIREFENSFKSENNLDSCIWTRDVLNLFLCTDSQFETELMTTLKTLITTAQDLEREGGTHDQV